MIMVVGHARFDPGDLDHLKRLAGPMIEASRAEAGCVDYCYALDLLADGVLHVYERWRDLDALKFHFQTPHMATFLEGLKSVTVDVTGVRVITADDGRPLSEVMAGP